MPIILLTPGNPGRKKPGKPSSSGQEAPPAGQTNLDYVRQRLEQRLGMLARRTRHSAVNQTRQRLGSNLPPAATKSASAGQAGSGPRPVKAGSAGRPSVLLADFFEDTPAVVARGIPPARSVRPAPGETGFELPESLADLGLAPRRLTIAQRFQTPAGRNFVARTPEGMTTPPAARSTPAPTEAAPASFEIDPQEGPYISMFDDPPPGTPQTVADEVRQRRPFTGSVHSGPPGQARVVGRTPFLELEDFIDVDNDNNEGEDEAIVLPQARPSRVPPADPANMVAEPTYDPNKRGLRRRGGPRRVNGLRFRNPAVALAAAMVSVTILAGIVFLLFYLGRLLDRATPEKFSVMYTAFGESQSFGDLSQGQVWARTLSTNFLERSGIANADVRLNTQVMKDAETGLLYAQRSQSDIVVGGYYDQKASRLHTTLILLPNGPYDPPVGRGRQLVERHLFDPDQITFITTPPGEAAASARLPLTQLLSALEAYYSGQYDDSLADLTQLLNKAEPENEPGLRMLRGNVLFAFGKYREAIEDYNQIININQATQARNLRLPVNPAFVYNNRAVALNLQGNYPEANKSFDTALTVRNDLPKVFANYAQFLLDRTDMEFRPPVLADWEGRLRSALEINPRLPVLHHLLGRIYYYQSQYDKAIQSQQKARELDPNYIEAYYYQGLSHLARSTPSNPQPNELNAAMTQLRDGESRASTIVTQNRQRWQSLNDNGKQTLAAVWDIRARETQQLADLLRFGMARVYLEQTRINGKDLGNPFDRIVRAFRSEKTPYEQAGPRLKEAVEARPEDPEANFYYGQFLDITGEGDPQPYYRKAKDLEKNIQRRFKYHELLARQYALAGKGKEAVDEYNQYIALDRNRVQGYLALSVLQYQLGQYRDAAAAADNAIRLEPNNAGAYLAAGAAQIGAQQLQQGVAYLDRAIVLNPQLSDAHLQRGIALFNLNRRREALDSLSKAIALDDNNVLAHYYAGIIYMETLKDSKSAQAEWEKAVAANPRYAEAWVKLGQHFSQINQINRAIDAYNRALAANEKDAVTHYYLGLLYETRNAASDLAQAERHYRRAIELTPGLVNAHYRLALVIQATGGKTEDALAMAQNAVKIDPRNAEAQVALGDIRRARSEYDPAIQAYNAALGLRQDYPEALYGRAAAYLGKQQFDPALADTGRALQSRPGWPEALILQGQIYVGRRQLDEAAASFNKALEVQPSNPNLLAEIANLQELRGQLDQAIASYETSLRLYEPNPRVNFRLAQLYFTRTNFNSALQKFQRVEQLAPTWPRIQYWLGRTYIYTQKYDEAQKQLEKMVQQEPNYIEARYELGNVYRIKKQRDLALAQYDEALKLQPAFSPAWLTKGQIYEEIVNLPKAREAYENARKSNDTQIRDAAESALRRLGVR